jgi:dihydroflavonol-4-reductase
MPIALVTGGSGFLGFHVCAALKEQGWQVRSLNRSHSHRLESLEVEQFLGDVCLKDDLLKASDGIDASYHLAGHVSRDPLHSGAMFQLHLKGTQNWIDSIRHLKISNALYMSTSGVVGVSEDDQCATEANALAWDYIRQWPYYESKGMAEECVWRACKEGLPIKIARPSLFLGPGDPTGGSHDDVLTFLGGGVKAALPGGLSAVDVRDVAQFLPLLMEKGKPGVGYLLGGRNLTIRTFLNQLAQISGVTAPLLDLPFDLTNKAPGILKWISKQSMFGGIDPKTFEMGCHFWYVDSTLAQSLGFTPRPLSETLVDALNDLETRGFWRRT